jgi:hypothetical protein
VEAVGHANVSENESVFSWLESSCLRVCYDEMSLLSVGLDVVSVNEDADEHFVGPGSDCAEYAHENHHDELLFHSPYLATSELERVRQKWCFYLGVED